MKRPPQYEDWHLPEPVVERLEALGGRIVNSAFGPGSRVDTWRVGSGLMLAYMWAGPHDTRGWDLFTPPNTNDVEATLLDVKTRTGAT